MALGPAIIKTRVIIHEHYFLDSGVSFWDDAASFVPGVFGFTDGSSEKAKGG
jgi:hypothetical protein